MAGDRGQLGRLGSGGFLVSRGERSQKVFGDCVGGVALLELGPEDGFYWRDGTRGAALELSMAKLKSPCVASWKSSLVAR
jgi:hypothetical protein